MLVSEPNACSCTCIFAVLNSCVNKKGPDAGSVRPVSGPFSNIIFFSVSLQSAEAP